MADGLTIDSLSIEVGYQANNASGGVDKLTASLNNLKSAIRGNGLQGIVTQLSNLSQVITAMPVGKLQRAVASLEKLKGSNGLGGVSSAVQNTASTMPEVSGTVEVMPVDVSSIEQVRGELKNTGNEATKTKTKINGLTNSVKKSTSAFGSFLKSIGRIALYRAIRSAIKMVTTAFAEGVKNVVQYSKAIGEIDSASANTVMSEYATVLLQVKNSIGACVAPLLQALLPAITAVANGFINAVNAVNQFISSLQGKTVFTKAKSYAVDYADSLNSASSAVNELKKQTMGFDELNILNNNSSSGSGSSSSYDYSKMFSEETIDVDALTEKFNNFGVTVANILNFCIEKVHNIVSVLKTIKWVEVAKIIVEWLFQAFENIDWTTLAYDSNLVSIWHALLPIELTVGILVGLLKSIIKRMIPFVQDELEKSGGNIGKAILNGWWDMFKGIYTWVWTNVIKPFVDAYVDLIGGAETVEKIKSGGKKIVTYIGEGIGNIWEKLKLKFNDFADSVGTFFGDIAANMLKWGINVVASLVSGIGDIWAKIRFAFDTFTTKVELFFFNAKEKAAEFGKNFVDAIKAPFSNLGTAIKSGLNDMIEKIESAINSIADRLNGKTFSLFGKDYTVNLARVSIPRLASGGILNAGQMFIANEAGPELVGNVGRKTAVMNSSQIVEAVSMGVANAVARAMGGTSQAVNVNVDGDTLFSFVVKKNNQQVYSTGASPLLV